MIVIIIAISFPSCLDDDKENGETTSDFRKSTMGDIELSITLESPSKMKIDVIEILINVEMKNDANETILIDHFYRTLMYPRLIINETEFRGTTSATDLEEAKYDEFIKGNTITFSLNILDALPYRDVDGDVYAFPDVGHYSFYILFSDIATSNIIEFEIE